MIKRIRFAEDHPGTGERVALIRQTLEAGLNAGAGVRPLRVALCTALPDVIGDQPYDAVGIEWFEDPDHLARFARWRTTGPGHDAEEFPTVEVEEVVLRGQDWLERRWRRGGEALKHMAIARRAEGLTPSEFLERWRARAGTVRAPDAAAAVAIPEEARGKAYVQNHPVPRTGGEWAYDAVNEVYFEDLDGLRRRIAWFEDTLASGTEDDLVRENWFLAVREVELPPR